MKELFLHIGTHKTGSTSLQAWLLRHRDALQRQDLHLANAGLVNNNHFPLYVELRSAAASAEPAQMPLWEQLADELHASPGQRSVVSCEDFSDLEAPAVALLADFLQRRGVTVHAVIFLRKQSEILRSNYVELLKQGLIDQDFASYIAQCYLELDQVFSMRHYDYRRMLEPWLAACGRDQVHVLRHSTALDTVGSFARLLQLDRKALAGPQRRLNVSPPSEVVAALLAVNRYLWQCRGVDQDRRTQIAYGLYDQACRRYARGGHAEHEAPGLREMLNGFFADSNRWLFHEFGIKLNPVCPTRTGEARRPEELRLPHTELDYWYAMVRCDVEYSLELVV